MEAIGESMESIAAADPMVQKPGILDMAGSISVGPTRAHRSPRRFMPISPA
jgi:hypothetical protein